MSDFIPPADPEFDDFQNVFTPGIIADPAAYGISPADATALQNAQTAWVANYAAHLAAVTAALTAAQGKDSGRTTYEPLIRAAAKTIQANTAITDTQRVALRLPVHATTRTPVPVPATRPLGRIETGLHLCHILRWTDETTPTKKARPDGVRGVEIWGKVGGAAPVDPSECHYIAVDSKPPYMAEYTGADAGKIAYYILRWVNTRNEPGPWSDTLSAMIGG